MPRDYTSAQSRRTSDHDDSTDVVLFVGEGTAFPSEQSGELESIPDGRENTILAIELLNSGIHWLEPRDLRYPDDIFEPSRHALLDRLQAENYTPHLIFADFKVYALNLEIAPDELEALITVDGGEPITRAELVRRGFLF